MKKFQAVVIMIALVMLASADFGGRWSQEPVERSEEALVHAFPWLALLCHRFAQLPIFLYDGSVYPYAVSP